MYWQYEIKFRLNTMHAFPLGDLHCFYVFRNNNVLAHTLVYLFPHTSIFPLFIPLFSNQWEIAKQISYRDYFIVMDFLTLFFLHSEVLGSHPNTGIFMSSAIQKPRRLFYIWLHVYWNIGSVILGILNLLGECE